MKPKLVINQDVYDEIMFYVHRSQYEVSGMGKVVVEPNGVLRVVSQIMLPQKNRSTHTQVEPDDINKLLYELGESPRFWWHSHVRMGVFWSGEDMETIKANAGPEGWFINTVFNQDAKMKTAYYAARGLLTPWGNNPLWFDDCETSIDKLKNPKEEEWEATYTKNVTNVSTYQYSGSGYYGGKVVGLGEQQAAAKTPAATSTTTQANTGEGETTNFSAEPPLKRPTNMPKRVFKAWKRAWRARKPEEKNDYAFTEEERMILTTGGYTDKDVDDLVAEDFTPKEVLEIAASDLTLFEINRYINGKVEPVDIMRLVRHDAQLGGVH